jgi:threonine dehydrogenase-like Zn-dependent dehydrogenase
MIAARLCTPRHFETVEVETIRPGPGDVLVRLSGCGIFASNLPLWEGRAWFQYPQPFGHPGHEGWGYVDAVGQGVDGLLPGDPVTVLSSQSFSQYEIVPSDCVVPLPARLRGRAFPGEPLACAVNVFSRTEIEPGQDVAVVGAGFLGLLLIQLANAAGARVVAISRRRSSLSLARRYGAQEVIALTDDWTMQTNRIRGIAGFPRVIEAAGTQQALDIASSLIGERGRLVIAGYHQDGPREINLQQWNWRGIDVINAHERDPQMYLGGMRRAIQAVCEHRLEPWPLLTHHFPLIRINEAFRSLIQRPDGFVKAVIDV